MLHPVQGEQAVIRDFFDVVEGNIPPSAAEDIPLTLQAYFEICGE